MAEAAAWTVGRLLQWTTDHFKTRGSDSPRLDAEVLLAEARGCPRIQLYTAFEDVPPAETLTAFRELVRRRAEGAPVAYLVGRREFYSLSFRVSPDVLIPRPETEFLLIALLDLAKALGDRSALRIADVGTGSGILAVRAARQLSQAQVAALDLSPAALDVARANAAAHGVAERIEFVESDLLAALPAEQKFDFIVSNPPYVSSAEYAQLSPQVKNFEPRLALEAGPRGTEVIERLIPQAAERLESGGSLLLEIGPMLEGAVRKLLESAGCYHVAPTIKDLAGLARVIHCRRK